jgi:hypothetical protein
MEANPVTTAHCLALQAVFVISWRDQVEYPTFAGGEERFETLMPKRLDHN